MISRLSSAARRLVIVCALACACAATAAAQGDPNAYRISYRLWMSQPASHLFDVEIKVERGAGGGAVEFQMPRWSPGRYSVYDFAKNVQEVRASGRCGPAERCGSREYPARRVDSQTWSVSANGSPEIKFTYKVFADDLSGTFSQLDERHANVNGGSVFMYVAGHKQDPVTLQVAAPAGWRVVHGHAKADGAEREWEFANYDLLIDTPAEAGPDWTIDEFKVDGKTYRVVLHAVGGDGGRRADLARDLERIVRAETAMWNGAPDYDAYTFIFHFDQNLPRGDGMEHLNSTQIITRRSLADARAYDEAVDTAAHEFFHVWNVKRLRPAELGPWDFTRPVATRSLWIAEGVTNYYGRLMQRRAGLWDDARLYVELAAQIGVIENAPGSRHLSAEEASLIAPFTDRAVHYQRTNLAQTTYSYYDKGETLGLTLDLLIRARTGGAKSLDDVLRRMYEEFYVKSPAAGYYLRGRGYTGADFERAVSEVAGASFSQFFEHHVRAPLRPPYEDALAAVGLRLSKTGAKDARGRARDEYKIEEIKDAPADARRLREAWLTGKR